MLNRSQLATRAGALASETILRTASNNFTVRVRVGVRFPFKLLNQSRTPVSGRNIEKRLARILYMIPRFCFEVVCTNGAPRVPNEQLLSLECLQESANFVCR